MNPKSSLVIILEERKIGYIYIETAVDPGLHKLLNSKAALLLVVYTL